MAGLKTQMAPQEFTDETTSALEYNEAPISALQDINNELASLYAGESLTKNELRAITAVIAYVAYTQKVSEETVAAIVATAFGVKNVNALPREHYDDVIHYLVDLQLNEIMN